MRILLALAGLLGLSACSDSVSPTTPRHPAAIDSFVASLRLPDKQPADIVPIGPPGVVWLFRVEYGTPNDCPSGCFYSSAYGLMNNQKIAWFELLDYDGRDVSGIPLYAFDPTDFYLFKGETFHAIEAVNLWFYRYSFLQRLAESTNVGSAPLALVAYTLFEFTNVHLAETLIENSVVRADREILFTLAGLPSRPGDPYADVRTAARQLLGIT
jgi:hypothetical protein